MNRNLMLGALAVLAGLAGCTGQKPAPTDDFADLQSVDEKSDAFSKKMSIVGSLDYGQTSTAVKYHNPPQYRAFKFGGKKGDKVQIDVRSKTGDAVAWLLDDSFKTLTSNDDANANTVDSHLAATLPGNKNPAIITYYIVFRDYYLDDASFTVELKGPAKDLYSCKVDADCVRVRPDCCKLGAWTAVNVGSEQAFRDSLQCPAHLICPLIYVIDDHSVAECNNATQKCEAVKPENVVCGGFRLSNTHQCPGGYLCRGDGVLADAPGKCIESCGGITGKGCSKLDQVCVDDPTDGCDPANGGADCGGICKDPPADCRTSGCAPGSNCQVCKTINGPGYVCLPNGAVC